jgi:hypothetical protein
MSERDEPVPGERPDAATTSGGPPDHPEELLAGYVDGSATAHERAAVDAHLASCARCREEVDLARGALAALRTLPELESPWGGALPLQTTEAAGGGTATRPAVVSLADRRARRARVAWRGGAVATAAAVVALLLYLGPLSGGHRASTTPARVAATSGPPKTAQRDPLAALADALAGPEGTGAPTVPSTLAPNPSQTPTGAEDTCLRAAAGVPSSALLVHFDRTTYQGQPAYVVGYLAASSTDQSGRVVVAAVSRPGCGLIHLIRVPVGSSP